MKTETEKFQEAKRRFIDKLNELGMSEIAANAESATTMAELEKLSNSADIDRTLRPQLQLCLCTYGPDRTYPDSLKSLPIEEVPNKFKTKKNQ